MKLVFTCLLSITLFASASLAASPATPTMSAASQERAEKSFAKNDANSDGSLSKDEFLAKHTQKFNEIDANHDGKISRQEMQGYRGAIYAEREKRKAARLSTVAPAAKGPASAEKAPVPVK